MYSNSIEIEWKQGGASDAFYLVKYRQHPTDPELDFDDYEDDDEGTLVDFRLDEQQYQQSASVADVPQYLFKRLNTTSTKVKVGNALKPFTVYEFRVVAVNMLGRSEETQPLLVRTAATSNCFF